MKARKIFLISGSLFLPVLFNGAEPNFSIYYCPEQTNSSDKIGYIFAHGLGATHEQASLFLPLVSKRWIFNTPTILFDFPDAKNNNMEYHATHVNLGQETDIQRLEYAFEKACEQFPEYKFVLGGISRGSATIINFVALHQPQSIGALVLESPFDLVDNVINHILERFCLRWIPFSKKIAYKIAKKNFPLLNMNGVFPIYVVNKIPRTIPIIIIHSRRDKTIPINSSRNLYKELLVAGHTHVYILELASGQHGKKRLPEIKKILRAFITSPNL
jgi:predicted esterase